VVSCFQVYNIKFCVHSIILHTCCTLRPSQCP
jgi:hypothetical protein